MSNELKQKVVFYLNITISVLSGVVVFLQKDVEASKQTTNSEE